jgi:transcriptional regulator with XRE-family HTH domain
MGKYTNIAGKVSELRLLSGLTQEDVAQKLDISRQRWIMVEQGNRDLSTDELEILASIFGISVADFFEETRNNEKFKQMYFYFLRHCANDYGKITKTKLAKLLYLADFKNYFEELESMSGVKYIRREYGPVADIFFEMTEDLYDNGKIDIIPYKDSLLIKPTSNEIGVDLLNESEKQSLSEICALWKKKRTKEIVNYTHEQKPWKMCRDGEYIPYSLIIQEDPNHVYQPVA